MTNNYVYPPLSELEIKNASIARKVAANGMVLLENRNNVLPLDGDKTIALFGGGAVRTVRGGTGSGDPFNGGLSGGASSGVNQSPRYHINIMDSFIRAGYNVVTEDLLLDYAIGYDKEAEKVAGNPMLTFMYPEFPLKEDEVKSYAAKTGTAVYILSRNSGEGADRDLTKKITVGEIEYEIGDYLLSATELENLKYITELFEKTILVLNVGGVINMSELVQMEKLDSILLMSLAGQEGGDALLDVLTGKVIPSGKLTDTWAAQYKDYPASETFAGNDGNIDIEKYTESIYVGYRWFDSFGKTPIYPFGYGMSYTKFHVENISQSIDGETITIIAKVTNVGTQYAGREVVQVYCSAPEKNIERPYQELVGFAKTKMLSPGESEELAVKFNLSDIAAFNYDSSAYKLEEGNYRIRVGTSSRDTEPTCIINLDRDVTTRLVNHQLPLSQPLDEISRLGELYGIADSDWTGVPILKLDPEAIKCIDNRSIYQDESITTYTTDNSYKPLLPYEKVSLLEKRDVTLEDVVAGKATLEDLVAQMSVEELAELNCGTGWGVANENSPIVGASSSTIAGAAGETTTNLWDQYKIPSIVLADGPAGIRVNQKFDATDVDTGKKETRYQYCTAWPVGTLIAQSFDLDLIEEVGKGISDEMDALGVSVLLGPGLNIHRDPLCGRNFEYYSEDPFLSGHMAAAYVRGVQVRPHTVACIKHYAANNQESNRYGVDTIVSERALRDIYLRNFEIAVRESKPLTIMCAYNKINGIPASDSFDLNTNIARGEWGFEGLIMTDWNGGMSTPSISMHAGNDLIMPGGSGRINNIVLAATVKQPSFDERGQVEFYEERSFISLLKPAWNSFAPNQEGEDTVEAPLGNGYTATVENDTILVNGEPLYMEHIPELPPQFRRPGMEPGYAHPVTTKDASISNDGKSILYKGIMTKSTTICKGDIQRCAINNIKVIMRCNGM